VAATEGSRRDLEKGEWRLLAILGLPTFAFALGITVVSTYLPLLAQRFAASTTVIGVLIGGEGLMALLLPIPAGAWSDRLRTRIGGRLPFVLFATPPMAVALALVGFSSSLGLAAIFVALFFAAYFVAYEPYRALYPDLVDDDIAGRGQSTQAIARGVGTVLAIVVGGALFSLGKPLPFIAGAVVTTLSVAAFLVVLLRRGVPDQERERDGAGVREATGRILEILRNRPAVRSFLVANGLWELSLAALKTFVILYLTRGLGFQVTIAALIVGGGALFVVAASPVSGKLGDRIGKARVMQIALVVYGIGLLIPGVTHFKPALVAIIPFVAFGGGVIMTLPYALLIPLMPERDHGSLTGLYSLSRGLGTMLGPLLAGIAISALSSPLSATKGYQAMWLVCGAATLLSLVPLRRLRREIDEREQREREREEQEEQGSGRQGDRPRASGERAGPRPQPSRG
jgi:MFS family permease